jgi:tetratricopeptide (TPR) repeat protein
MLSVLAGEQAMQSILECQQKYPDSPWLAQFQAQMFVHQGQYQQAEAIYTQLLGSHAELPDLRHEAAMLFRSQGEWESALALFRDELAADSTDDRAVTGISESLIQLGRYTDAVDFLAPRFDNSPAPLWAAMDLALAYQKLGKYEKAIGILSRAEKAYPNEKSIHFRLMRLYHLTGQMDLARKEDSLFTGASHP